MSYNYFMNVNTNAVQSIADPVIAEHVDGFIEVEDDNPSKCVEVVIRLAHASGIMPEGLEHIPAARYSSEGSRDSYSIARQLALVETVAKQYKGRVNYDLKIVDEAVSASRIDPKTGLPCNMSSEAAFGKWLIDVDAGRFDPRGRVIDFESINRMFRTTLDLAETTFWGLVRKGFSFYFIHDCMFVGPGDIDNPVIKSTIINKLEMANQMPRELSRRILDTQDMKLDSAIRGERIAWGSWVPRYLDYIETPKPHYEFNPKRHALLIRIIAEVLAGDPLYTIANRLNVEEIPSWSGKHKNGVKHNKVDPTMVTKSSCRCNLLSVKARFPWEGIERRESSRPSGFGGVKASVASLNAAKARRASAPKSSQGGPSLVTCC